jgi:hypothetical protein
MFKIYFFNMYFIFNRKKLRKYIRYYHIEFRIIFSDNKKYIYILYFKNINQNIENIFFPQEIIKY